VDEGKGMRKGPVKSVKPRTHQVASPLLSLYSRELGSMRSAWVDIDTKSCEGLVLSSSAESH